MKALLEKIRKILRNRRTRQLLARTVSGFAAVVVFVTTYALVLPAITMEQEASCGITAHEHTDACYEERLVCQIPEDENHHHDASCYEKFLICGQQVHVHITECYQQYTSAVVSLGSTTAASTDLGALVESELYSRDDSGDDAGSILTDSGSNALETVEEDSSASVEDSDLAADTSTESEGTNPEASGNGISENTDSATTNPADAESQSSEENKIAAPEENRDAVPEENESVASEGETGSRIEGVNDDNESLGLETADSPDLSDGSGSVSDASDRSAADTSDAGQEFNDPAAGTSDVKTENAETAGAESAETAYTESAETAGTEAAAQEAANSATTNVLPEAAENENLSEGYVPELDSIEFGSVLNKHTDFYYFHPEEGQEIPASSAEITDWKKVKNDLFGSTELESTDLVKLYLSYTIPAGALNETNQVARYRLPSNIHLTDEQIIAINSSENGMSAIYAEADLSDTEEAARNENAANYQKYLGVEAIEGTRTPDRIRKEDEQEYISAIVKAENVFDDEGLYGEKGAFLGQDLLFIFTPYSIEKNQTNYNADGNPLSAGEKITGWFACDFNMSQIDWVEEDTDLDNSTVEKTAEVIFVEKDSEKNVKEISRKLKLVDTTEEHSDAANGGETEAVAETAAAETAVVAETAATAETVAAATTASETAATDETALASTGITSEQAAPEDTENGSFKSGTLTADGDGYRITLDYTEEAKIPENAELSVREITAETDKEAYASCLEQAGQQVAADEKTSVDQKASRFFDIEILVKDTEDNDQGETHKIEPAAPVSVNIQIIDDNTSSEDAASMDKEASQSEPAVLHFAEEGVEQIDSTVKTNEDQDDNKDRSGNEENEPATEISFEAESFSIYGVVYTVDFHWEINGKMYEFSLPGGGFVSFTDLVEVLGITGDSSADENGDKIAEDAEENKSAFAENAEENAANEEAEGSGVNSDSNTPLTLGDIEVSDVAIKFVADVTNVEFSSPELVDISKVNADTTVGQIKESRGLECQYSAELLEEQIAEINAQTVEAGDWALISVQPFTSEERLTVTMKDGSEFTIRVTDAQTDAVHNSEGTVQTVPNPTGTTIDLFNYYVDSDRKKRANRYQWPGVYENDMWKYNWYNFDGSLAESNYDTGWNNGEDWRKQHLIGNGNNLGINKNHIFKFTPANDNAVIDGSLMDGDYHKVNKNGSGGVNSYTGNADPNQGLVQGKLVNGYPALSNNPDEGTETTNPSLAYLFNGDVVEGKDRYDGVNHLLYVDPDGYYTYDSRDFKVDFDTTNKTFTLTDQDTDDTEKRGFWPFGEQVFWSGLHMNTQFSMPANGQVLNPKGEYKDMQFEFSGDDDTWLYVDGVLVGDGGGIHNRTEIDINFAKGTVTVTGKKGGSHSGTFEETKYLDDIFRNAEKYNEDDWEDIGDGSGHKRFKAETYHTFDMFYLERGGGESNLYIHYNLVSTADFTGHKALNGLEDDERLLRDEFQFELIGLNGRYSSDGTLVDQNANALMPKEGSASGTGKAESPKLEIGTTYTYENGTTVPSWTYTTGVTEDGNINFGTIEIPDNPPSDMTYRYVIKEIPKDRTDKLDGVDYDHIDFDTKVYYMQATLDYWYDADDVNLEHGRPYLRKTYYLDDTFQTPIPDKFVSFTNEVHHPSGSVEFTKVDAANSPLAGATFTLYTDETCTKVAKSLDGVEQVITTESDGKVVFDNMAAPKIYYMKETQKPGEEYIQNDTIYEVSVSETGSGKTSVITVYGEENAEPLTSIVNSKEGELSVKKVWLDRRGNLTTGRQNVNVTLKRKKTEFPADLPANHITFQMHIADPGWGPDYSNMTVTMEKEVLGYNAAIEWYDCWQNEQGHLTSLTVTKPDGTPISTDHYEYWNIDENNHSVKLLLYGISEGARVEVEYDSGVAWLWQNDNKTKVQSPSIEAGEIQPEIVEDDDFAYESFVLSSPDYLRVWKTGGNPDNYEAAGYDLPAVDANDRPYYYYVEELEMEGYQTTYANNEGITEGQIRITNQAAAENNINVVIKKTDNAENSTNYLDGAVFKMMYRSDSSGTFTNVSNESVPELDSDSQFTVPTAGIILTGLVDGQYLLQEISSPSGYVITNSTPVTFTVSGGTITSTEGTITGVRYSAATETSNAEFIVPNPPGAALPNTGGPGSNLIYLLGITLIGLGGVGLVMKKRLRTMY